MVSCGKCHRSVSETTVRVLETRQHVFPYRWKAHRFRKPETLPAKKCRVQCTKVGRLHIHDDPGGVGTQIVKEIRVCKECQ